MTKQWKINHVELVSHNIDSFDHKEMIDELAEILYREFSQFEISPNSTQKLSQINSVLNTLEESYGT